MYNGYFIKGNLIYRVKVNVLNYDYENDKYRFSNEFKKNIYLKYSWILFIVLDKCEITINIMYKILQPTSNNNV